MKLIIAGSRTVWPDDIDIDNAIYEHYRSVDAVSEVVSGKCRDGADACGERWAKARGKHVTPFPADWDGPYKKAAGKLRNREMADYADAALVFWDGMSSGSADMVCRMVARGKPVRVVPMKASKK